PVPERAGLLQPPVPTWRPDRTNFCWRIENARQLPTVPWLPGARTPSNPSQFWITDERRESRRGTPREAVHTQQCQVGASFLVVCGPVLLIVPFPFSTC